MNKTQIYRSFGIFFLFATLAGCSDSQPPGNDSPGNSAPIANAGPDRDVTTNQTVQLDGSNSSRSEERRVGKEC